MRRILIIFLKFGLGMHASFWVIAASEDTWMDSFRTILFMLDPHSLKPDTIENVILSG